MSMMVPLRRLASVVNGGTPTAEADNWDGDVHWATPVDVGTHHGGVITDTIRTLTELGLKTGSASVPAGSVILSTRAPVGYVAQAGVELAFNQGCKGLVPTKGTHPGYLSYALIHSGPAMQAAATGTTFAELSTSSLSTLRVPLWPLDEQRAIADFLDRETAQIDAMIEAQQDLVAGLEERLRAVLNSILFDVDSIETRRRVAGHEWLGSIPMTWTPRPLWSMFRRRKVLGYTELPMISVFRDHGVVFKDDFENLNKTAEDRSIYQLVEPGWLVVNRMKAWQGSVGVSRIRGISSGHYICFEPKHNQDHNFLNHLLRSSRYAAGFAANSRGVRIGQAEIDNDRLRVIPLVLPPLAEQRRIASAMNRATARTDALIAAANESIALMQERRAALISATVTGRMDPRTGMERVVQG